MPRHVDREERKREIVMAAAGLLADGGFAEFGIRALARRMGGSMTLITHYFPNRDAILAGLMDLVSEEIPTVVESFAAIEDPRERLRNVLDYFLPASEELLMIERARVALASHKHADPAVAAFFRRVDPEMRDVLVAGLSGVVPDEELESVVDLLRVWTSGIVLSAVEHPERWAPERQREARDHLIRMLAAFCPLLRPVGAAGD